MVLQAYIDDSADEGDFFVLGGYVATAEKWAAFSREWEALLKPFGVLGPNGKYRFKMAEMAASAERIQRVGAFHAVISKYAPLSVSAIVRKSDIDKALARVDSYPVTTGFSKVISPFHLCYRALMHGLSRDQVSESTVIDILGQPEPVDFYFDECSEKALVWEQWDSFKRYYADETQNALFGSPPRFESDDDFLPLQAADFRAYWVREFANSYGIDGINKGRYPFPHSKNPMQHRIYSYDEDNLTWTFMDWAKRVDPSLTVVDRGPSQVFVEDFPLGNAARKLSKGIMSLFRRS